MDIFQKSIDLQSTPAIWKKTNYYTVPKRLSPKEHKDYHLVALTCIVMKCLERSMVWRLKEEVKHHLDPYQFTYQINRGTDPYCGASCFETSGGAKGLGQVLSSAFNTVQPHLMLSKLNNMAVNPYSIKWFHAFLTDRTQQVKIKQSFSECLSWMGGACE